MRTWPTLTCLLFAEFWSQSAPAAQRPPGPAELASRGQVYERLFEAACLAASDGNRCCQIRAQSKGDGTLLAAAEYYLGLMELYARSPDSARVHFAACGEMRTSELAGLADWWVEWLDTRSDSERVSPGAFHEKLEAAWMASPAPLKAELVRIALLEDAERARGIATAWMRGLGPQSSALERKIQAVCLVVQGDYAASRAILDGLDPAQADRLVPDASASELTMVPFHDPILLWCRSMCDYLEAASWPVGELRVEDECGVVRALRCLGRPVNALERHPQGASADQLSLRAELAACRWVAGDHPAAGRELLELLQQAGEGQLAAIVESQLSVSANLAECASKLDAAHSPGAPMPQPDAPAFRLCHLRARVLQLQGGIQEARDRFDDLFSRSLRGDLGLFAPEFLADWSVVMARVGNYDELLLYVFDPNAPEGFPRRLAGTVQVERLIRQAQLHALDAGCRAGAPLPPQRSTRPGSALATRESAWRYRRYAVAAVLLGAATLAFLLRRRSRRVE